MAYMLCPHCGQELKHIKIRTETETLTLAELVERLKILEEQARSGRCTPIEDFPEEGLHSETERVIDEYLLALAVERTKVHGLEKAISAKDVYNSLGIVSENFDSIGCVEIE